MDFSKLTRAHVFLIGAALALILGVTFFFLGPYKTNQNLGVYDQRLQQANAVISTKADKEKALKDAEHKVVEAKAVWAQVSARKMPKPPIDLSKTDERSQLLTMIRLWKEPATTVPLMERFALSPRNVIVQTSFGVPGQPTDPRGIPQQVIEWPLGTVTVQGSFPEILRYFRRWNQAPRLVAVDGFQLTGTSPFLTATASVTAYIFPIPNPQAAAAVGGAGGYGGYGGATDFGGYGGAGGSFGGPGSPYDSGAGGPGGAYGPGGPAGPYGPGATGAGGPAPGPVSPG